MKNIVQGKVTSEQLRQMPFGEPVVFMLPDADSIRCGKSIAYQLQHSIGCKFTAVSDFDSNQLTLTKHPKP